jgi:hypothetical protein
MSTMPTLPTIEPQSRRAINEILEKGLTLSRKDAKSVSNNLV